MTAKKQRVVLIIHNVRSALNVGSMLRTADGLGVDKVYLTGYSPYPESSNDTRLPHIRRRTALQIHKTALGAEFFVAWQHQDDIRQCLADLRASGFIITALEQTADAQSLDEFQSESNIALLVGNEIDGLDQSLLKLVDSKLHIPMKGRKESFNVAVAAAIALYILKAN